VIADLDGDGDLDVVEGELIAQELRVFLQSSPGTFAVSQQLGGFDVNAPASLAIGDLDSDGDPDVCAADSNGTR
jgi:hypothetical protein